MRTDIVFFGQPAVLECDSDCDHDWGINWNGETQGIAPQDPGTYEGGCAKPTNKHHNKWCARECERSELSRG